MEISIIIPTWNKLPYLKICVESIRKNSVYDHQIIIHVNEGSDGTLSWLKEQGLDYTYTEENVGVCLAVNMMRTKVKTDYILEQLDHFQRLYVFQTHRAAVDYGQRLDGAPSNRHHTPFQQPHRP